MDETLANLLVVIKAVGLNESKTGLRDLSAVLDATGMSAEGLAAAIRKSGTAMEHVNDITRAHAMANRDAEMFSSRYATTQEKVLGLLGRLEQARGHISSTEIYNRALADLNLNLAEAEGRFVSLASVQKSAANIPKLEEYGPARPTSSQLAADVRAREAEETRRLAEAERALNAARNAAAAIVNRNATDEEQVQARIREAKNLYASTALGVDDYRRAMNELSGELAEAQGRFVSLGSVQASAQSLANRNTEQQNLLNMQGTNLLRQLESAQEAHTRRLAHYRQLLQASAIDQRTFNRAVQESERAMRSQSALGGKGGGLASMQIGYAAQDFATVAAMGGEGAMARGLMAASNNLGQMVVVAGVLSPMMAAITATAVTLAAVLGPKIWDYFISGAETSEEIMKRLVEEARNLNKSLEEGVRFRSQIANANEGGSSGQIGDRLVSLSRDSDTEQAAIAERRRQQRLVATQIQMESNAGIGRFANSADVIRAGGGTAAQITTAMGLDFTSGGNTTAAMARQLGPDAFAAYQRGLQSMIASDERMVEAREGEREASENLARIKLQSVQAEQDLIDAINREAAERDRAFAEMQQQQRASQAGSAIDARRAFQGRFEVSDIGVGVRGEKSQYESKYDSIFQSDIELIRNARGAGSIDSATAYNAVNASGKDIGRQIDADIAALEGQNKSRFQPSMAGFSDFGKQFQMALLKPDDEAKKQREKQIEELQKIREALATAYERELNSGVGA